MIKKLFYEDPLFFILLIAFILFIPILSFAYYAPKIEVDNCINLGNGKYILPKEAVVIVDQVCKAEPCYQIPTGFMCQTYSVVPKSSSTECSLEPPAPPENGSPTEPLPPPLPQCEFVTCPPGQTKTIVENNVLCSWEALELNPAKQATYDTQKAAAETTQSTYQESQLYNNLQDYCLYTTGLACPAMPPATFNATASSFSYITGKPLAQIKKLMNKKIGKKK